MNQTHATPFDYRPFVLRTDAHYPAVDPSPWRVDPATLDLAAVQGGDFQATLPLILLAWEQTNPDPDALAACFGVLTSFIRVATDARLASWFDIDADLVTRFVEQAAEPASAASVRQLRKNVVHAAFLALAACHLTDGYSPAVGITVGRETARPAAKTDRHGKTRRPYEQRPHVRPATHDEVLLVRLAAPLLHSSRALHLTGAAVALACATATTAEAGQVTWGDLHSGADTPTVALIGRAARDQCSPSTVIAARTTTLDEWETHALQRWTHERQSSSLPTTPTSSVLYTGSKPLTDQSVQVCVDKQIRKALDAADLSGLPGLTAGSLRLWGAIRHAVDQTSAKDAAARLGIHPLDLHRQLTHGGERSWAPEATASSEAA